MEVKAYRVVDTAPKHLAHMTDEDFRKPDPMMVKSEMDELIKEARAKIQPVLKVMSDEELDSIIMTLEDAKKDK